MSERSIKATLIPIFTPILLPVIIFFVCYFLFPSFSYEFFGVSFRASKHPEVQKQTEFKNNSYNTSYNVEVVPGAKVQVDVPEKDVKNAVDNINAGVDTVKNIIEFAEETSKNAQSVLDTIRQSGVRK